ncbi:hypothetical protein LIER_21256 [Lithospermum erythrorhizon]|uniref:Secreted protein n=1 Tax=Lithospermum erythrorhizon TaxID=34254 RepID=A0AAV3QTQ8_LITER
MLHLFFSAAFSALPLTLYIPPLRNLTLFVEILEDLSRDSRVLFTDRLYHRWRYAFSRLSRCLPLRALDL